MSEVTDMEVRQAIEQHQQGAASEEELRRARMPEPPRVFTTGTILTLRKAGHLRSPVPGQEYFAPGIVLEQYSPNGEIDVIVFDPSAGVHFLSAYPIRDVDARTDVHNRREMYVKRENIGEVLFDPEQFKNITDGLDTLALSYSRLRTEVQQVSLTAGETSSNVMDLSARVSALESFVADLQGKTPNVPKTDKK